MNVTPFPNKPKCSCGNANGVILFLKAWGITFGILASVLATLYGGFRLIIFLGDKFGIWLTVAVISVISLSALIGFIFTNDTLSEQERQRSNCKTHNV